METINIEKIKQYLIDFYEFEPDQVSDLITTMTDSIVTKLNDLDESIKRESYKNIETAAHSLKGTLLNFGLSGHATISSEIEKKASAGGPVQLIIEFYNDLRTSLAPITEAAID